MYHRSIITQKQSLFNVKAYFTYVQETAFTAITRRSYHEYQQRHASDAGRSYFVRSIVVGFVTDSLF